MPLPIKITFLGTAGSTPTKERNLPSVALEYEGGVYLFDCGEGTQRQLMKYGINPNRIRGIFLTHMHGDHIIGVAGLVRTLALNKRMDSLGIYVPAGEEKKINQLLTFDRALIGYKIEIKSVKPGAIMKGKGFSVSAFRLKHSVPTFGYVFQEDERYHFDKEKCKKLGIRGEMYSKLYDGSTIKLKGRTISLGKVAQKQEGRKIVYATDTRPVEATENAAKNADLLIHETTYSEKLKELARQRLHSTAAEGATIAKKAKVKRLIMFHMSARYRKPDELIKEARGIFKNSDAAYDGMQITI